MITYNQLTSVSAITRLISTTIRNVLCIFSATDLPDKPLTNRPVIVTRDNPELLDQLINTNILPDHLPILILSDSTTPPDLISAAETHRLIDFLPMPIDEKLLHYKLLFLEHVQGISSDYYNNFDNHTKILDTLAKRDGLTGLYNRRYLTEILIEEFQKARTTEADLSMLILNIDYFNEINRSSGLSFGDAVLNEMSARLTVNSRDVDTCFRFSGEDFVILMPQADLELALETGEKIRLACADKPFFQGEQQKSITVSIGVASLKSHSLTSHDEFISMAETALYMAKAGGRNRIHAFSPLRENKEYSNQQSLGTLKETINRILEKTRCSTISSLQLLAKEIAGDEYKDHIERVSHYISLLGGQLGLPPQLITTFQNAITLHNSIRFFLHNDLFAKQSTLSMSERREMNDLPFKLAEITDIFDYFANERTVLLSHGERYDGNGSPHGLKGSEIPLGARLFNIVDSLAAMNSARPFRPKLPPESIIKELINEAGKQFDPHLVLQTLEMIKTNNLLDLDAKFIDNFHQNIISNFPETES